MNNPYQDGKILVVDKPLKWTSFDVVNKIRYAIKDKFQIKFESLDVIHGSTKTRGYLFNKIAYISDCKKIPKQKK